MLPIILAIKDEDDRSYVENLYEDNKRKIYLVAYDILKNDEDAKDCLQNVIESIIHNLEIFKAVEGKHFYNLLTKTTRNMAIDIYRRNKRRLQYETSVNDMFEMDYSSNINALDNDVAEIVINNENINILTKQIAELPTIYRDVLLMKYKEGYSNIEISRLLHISEDNIRKRLSRARTILLKKRKDELHDLQSNR